MDEMNETYEVTDGKIVIQADAIRRGAIYRPIDNGDGTVYLAENRRTEEDGSRMVMLSARVHRALQGFCSDMTELAGHRLEYSVTISGLVAWALHEERWQASEKRVLEYGTALYRGEKKDRLGRARLMRIPSDVINMMNQFASHLAETTGGLNPERAIILNALLEWVMTQEEAMEIVDDYNLQLINERKEARRRARAQPNAENAEHGPAHPIEPNGTAVTQETQDEMSDGSTVTKGTPRTATSES